MGLGRQHGLQAQQPVAWRLEGRGGGDAALHRAMQVPGRGQPGAGQAFAQPDATQRAAGHRRSGRRRSGGRCGRRRGWSDWRSLTRRLDVSAQDTTPGTGARDLREIHAEFTRESAHRRTCREIPLLGLAGRAGRRLRRRGQHGRDRGRGRAGVGHRRAGGALHLEHHDHGADRDHIADSAVQRDHGSRTRGRQIDRDLVRVHDGDILAFLDALPGLHRPLQQFGLVDALPDVGELELELHTWNSIVRAMPARILRSLGR